ncbi:hypothetical protein [Streptomyces chilikensis]|uniref:hypothetical protein n=1 Tax=Streptomyces chilikensis TaxID=1194079 RepID=UPI000B0EA7DF|nr:hypothetical protein [Streptomyces chilikensis]
MDQTATPAGVAADGPACVQVAGRDDPDGSFGQAVLLGAGTQDAAGIDEEVPHHDLSQSLGLGATTVGRQDLQEPAGIRSGLLETGGGVAGVGGQADRSAAKGGPFGVRQVVQDVGCVAEGLFQRGAGRFEDGSRRVSSLAADRIWVEPVRCLRVP